MNNLEAIAEALGRHSIDPSDRFDSFDIDSLEFLEFLIQVQSVLNITIPDSEIAGLNTVADLLKVIDKLHVSA